MKLRAFAVLTVIFATVSLAGAQPTQRMWYRGSFEGWVDLKTDPAYGYYYHPAPNSAYPLNEASYGQPIPCRGCGHQHQPGEKRCATCRQVCPAGGNKEAPNTVYRRQRLPGMYFYERQPHYRFVTPMRLGGSFRKYNQPF